MKLLTRTLSLLIITSLGIFFANCGGDGGSDSSPERAALASLSGTWVLGEVQLSEQPEPEQIGANFQLTIEGNYNGDSPEGPYTYSTTGAEEPSPWRTNGTWTFATVDENSGTISRDDGIPISYTLLSNGQLQLSFTYNGNGELTGKVNEVEGQWTFLLNPL